MEGKIDLDAMDLSYFRKEGEGVRKDGTLIDEEVDAILNDVSNDRNPFDREMPFEISELSQSKLIRASVKAVKENPEILILVAEEIGVENL